MGKGRTLTTSRSERYLGNFGSNYDQEMVNGASELLEDEVWSMADNTNNRSPVEEWSSQAAIESSGSFNIFGGQRPSPSTNGDHHRRGVGGLSLAFDLSDSSSSRRIVHPFCPKDSAVESPRSRHMASSAPVNVPDWSKIYRVDSVESLHEFEHSSNDYDTDVVPPHEYLARSRQKAANSVFEGVGRTLKGWDLTRVRDTVWSQTGFDG